MKLKPNKGISDLRVELYDATRNIGISFRNQYETNIFDQIHVKLFKLVPLDTPMLFNLWKLFNS
jgi:hypothetical protein